MRAHSNTWMRCTLPILDVNKMRLYMVFSQMRVLSEETLDLLMLITHDQTVCTRGSLLKYKYQVRDVNTPVA